MFAIKFAKSEIAVTTLQLPQACLHHGYGRSMAN
jgi:hypothetical protein